MDLPTPDDTSRVEDHADPGHEGGPSFFDLGCLSNLAVLIGVFLYGYIFGCEPFFLFGGAGEGRMGGGVNAVVWLFLWVYNLPILPIIVWIAGAVAYKGYKNRPFMGVGPKTLSLLLILSVTAMLATLYRSVAVGEEERAVDNLLLLILAALVILYPVSLVYHRFVVWITAVAADNAKYYAPVQRGAGKGKFFLDEDE